MRCKKLFVHYKYVKSTNGFYHFQPRGSCQDLVSESFSVSCLTSASWQPGITASCSISRAADTGISTSCSWYNNRMQLYSCVPVTTAHVSAATPPPSNQVARTTCSTCSWLGNGCDRVLLDPLFDAISFPHLYDFPSSFELIKTICALLLEAPSSRVNYGGLHSRRSQ